MSRVKRIEMKLSNFSWWSHLQKIIQWFEDILYPSSRVRSNSRCIACAVVQHFLSWCWKTFHSGCKAPSNWRVSRSLHLWFTRWEWGRPSRTVSQLSAPGALRHVILCMPQVQAREAVNVAPKISECCDWKAYQLPFIAATWIPNRIPICKRHLCSKNLLNVKD